MTRVRSFATLAGLVSAISIPGAALAQLPEGVTEMATVEGITEYRLDNGLRFLLFPDQSKQQITVNITYLVGSRHEGYGETGMAHLLEHLVFKGTPNHPDIPQELTEHGASPNGTTWFDRTNYFETFPATEENADENLEWALDLEADRMVNSFIAQEDLDSEMTVVRNEWEAGENSPQGVLQKRVLSAAYDWHNYGNSTIGARADVENVPIDRLQAFYRKYYQPDNAVLVVAGRFETARALELVAEKFGAIPRPDRTGANQLFPTYTAEPAQDGERSVTLRRVGDVQLAMVAYHVPPGSHEQFAAVDVMTHILATRPAGRLYQALVESGLAASAFAGNFQLREPGVLFAATEVRQGESLEEAADVMLATIHALVDEPPTEEEVERAKTDYLSSVELAFNNPQGIALQLSEWAAMGDWRLFFLHRDRIERVTSEAVHQVAQAYLKPSNRTIGYFYPTEDTPARAEIPVAPDVAALVASYAGREAVAEGEAFDPTIANIEARTERFELPSGMKVALLPKENRGDAVTLSLALRHGTEEALSGKATAASFAGAMLLRGTANRTRQEISDELDRLKAQGSVNGSVLTASGAFTTVRENLPAVLRLTAEVLREPAFDADEFEVLRQERLAALEAQMSEPLALAQQALTRHFADHPADHPRYAPTFEEQIERIEAVTVDEARAFWEEFYGAQAGTLAVVGDFDPAAIRSLLEELFSDWVGSAAYARVPSGYREVEPLTLDIETPDKTNAAMFARLTVRMRDDHPDYPALVLGNYMLGGGMNSRLFSRVRGEEGLSYAVGSAYAAQPIDDEAQFFAFAIFAPENGDKVVASFSDVLEGVLADGFTDEELEIARRGYLDQQQASRANDGLVAQMLSNGLFLDRPLSFTAEQEAAIEAVTGAEILAAMRRHIDPSRLTIVRGGDFANKLVP